MRLVMTRFLAARLVPLLLVMRLMMRLRLLTLRLDTAERTAKFLNLAFVGELLALSDLDELKDFVHLIVQFL